MPILLYDSPRFMIGSRRRRSTVRFETLCTHHIKDAILQLSKATGYYMHSGQELHAGDAGITAQGAAVSILPRLPSAPSVVDALLDADNLPDTGEWNSSTSPVRVRRQTQIALLQTGYRELFEKELTQSSATELLRLSGDRAAAVYGALEKAKERKAEFPVGYAKSVLRGDAKKQQPEVRPVNVGREDGEDFYMEPSPEYLRKVAWMKELGLLDEEEDEAVSQLGRRG